MNPGVTEEAGKTARSAIDALQSAPVILALVLLQIMVLAFLAWTSHTRTQSNEKLIELFHQQFNTLAQSCLSGSGPKLQSDDSRPFALPPLEDMKK